MSKDSITIEVQPIVIDSANSLAGFEKPPQPGVGNGGAARLTLDGRLLTDAFRLKNKRLGSTEVLARAAR